MPSTSGQLLKVTTKIVGRKAAKQLRGTREALSGLTGEALGGLAERTNNNSGLPLAARLRALPIQCSIDIAVPLEVAYEEWMKLEFLPEGTHRIERIKRRGDRLSGRLAGALAQHSAWRAEIREERSNESFAWRSVKGSDCVGLVTFHRLAERLTRIELELDVAPQRSAEAFELLVHVADRRAETDLRRFKADLERISPDDYPSLVESAGDDAYDEEEQWQ